MRQKALRPLFAAALIAGPIAMLVESGVANATRACTPSNSGNISTLQCFVPNTCANPADACYVASSNGCAGTVNANTTCNPTPTDLQVTFWQDINYQGSCITFEVPKTMGALSVPNLGDWGFHDCISSLKVGAKVRLHAYLDAKQGSGNGFYSNYQNGAYYPPWLPNPYLNGGVVYWQALYEPGPQSTLYTDYDSYSSLVLENLNLPQTPEPIPYNYRGDYPSNKSTIWSEEAQGLCHNKDNWFITKEAYLPDNYGFYSFNCTCSLPYVPMPSYNANGCVCGDPAYIDRNYSCVITDHRYTGRIYRWPLEKNLWETTEPDKQYYRDQREFSFLMNGVRTPSAKLGYRHFGDPDRMNIGGKDYIFVPVERCGNQAPGVILVLNANLDYVATWIVPSGPEAGTLGWVALRPGTENEPEVWLSGNIVGGHGLRKMKGKLQNGQPMDGLTLEGDTEVFLRSFQGPGEDIVSVSGGVFSPSGKTLYLVNGKQGEYGGIHVVDPTTGRTFADSSSLDDGHCYGPFCYGANVSGVGDEPEGMDFFDTRCTDKVIPGISVEKESQLHVFLLNNNITDLDNIRVKHYSINGTSTQSGEWGQTRLPLICDPGTTPADGGSPSAWSQGTVATGQKYPVNFNVFALGNLTGLQDVQGAVAAGGTVNLASFNLNTTNEPVGLVSNGSLTLTNGRIKGKIYYGDGSTVGSSVTCDDGPCSGKMVPGRPIDFGVARTALQGMSRALRKYPSNGTAYLAYGTNLILTGTSSTLNTFMVSAFDFAFATSVTINAPSGSTIVVNVSGPDVKIANAGFSLAGLDDTKVIWNFYEATKLTMTSVGFHGSALAPYADATLQWGSLSGTLVANSVAAQSELYYRPFRYDLLP